MVQKVRRNRAYAPRMGSAERREQLLDTVLAIINSDGVGAVNMDAVARRTGVTRPVVYSLFSGTDEILRASLDREEQRALAQLAGAVPNADATVGMNLHRLIDTYLRAVATTPERWRAIFMVADSGTPAFHKRVERGRALLVAQLHSTLRTAEVVDDAELMAHHLFAVLWDSGRLILVRPDEFTHDRLLRSLDRLVSALTQSRSIDNSERSGVTH